MKTLKSHRCFDGEVRFLEHDSSETRTKMKVALYRPSGAVKGVVIWLSGLTCTEENFITKAGAQRSLAQAGLAVVCPDTSPRGLDLPGEHASWDFGSGAGFYVDATTPNYRQNYRMYSYVANELYAWVRGEFQQPVSITGHSMGGHGALVLGLREPEKFRAVSAFAPIANPVAAPWGQKAFEGYLGERSTAWDQYDATMLLEAGKRHPHPILVDQGSADEFLEKQLMPAHLERAAKAAGQPLELRYRPHYDHSYYFISTFIDDHVAFHARALAR